MGGSFLSTALTCAALVAPGDPLELLRERAEAGLRVVANYTCVQNVVRTNSESSLTRPPRTCSELLAMKKRKVYYVSPHSIQRLRLDVALSTEREMFSWAGENRFDDRTLHEFLGEGAIGTGIFAGYLLNIFGANLPRVAYAGRDTFTYFVPRESSRHQIEAGRRWITTGYEGEIVTAADSAAITRLTVRLRDLPVASQQCAVEATVDYDATLDGPILPREARQRFIGRTGDEADVVTTFSDCREFRGESTVNFGTPQARPATAPRRTTSPIPAGLPITLELTKPIDTARAAAGDTFEARLVNTPAGLPAGATVRGRLTRVEQFLDVTEYVTVVFRPETVDRDGVAVPLNVVPRASRRAGYWIPLPGAEGKTWRETSDNEVTRRNERTLGVYHVLGRGPVLPAGVRMEWTTRR